MQGLPLPITVVRRRYNTLTHVWELTFDGDILATRIEWQSAESDTILKFKSLDAASFYIIVQAETGPASNDRRSTTLEVLEPTVPCPKAEFLAATFSQAIVENYVTPVVAGDGTYVYNNSVSIASEITRKFMAYERVSANWYAEIAKNGLFRCQLTHDPSWADRTWMAIIWRLHGQSVEVRDGKQFTGGVGESGGET